MVRILITGGCGFIGMNLVNELLSTTAAELVTIDTSENSCELAAEAAPAGVHTIRKVDIRHTAAVAQLFSEFQPNAVVHLAAETHVDRSIETPLDFVDTNVVGTASVLECARAHLTTLSDGDRDRFRFLHVSTDEVFGDLSTGDSLFGSESKYAPSSPYAASKAAADHLVRAWYRTYGLPGIVVNTTNNYGPFQHPEKLIPHMILSALSGRNLPLYGDGLQVRDWLFVQDHARALIRVLEMGQPGSTFLIGGSNQITNLEVVETLCKLLDEKASESLPATKNSFLDLIESVPDRPGHDRCYGVDPSSIRQLGWQPEVGFSDGLRMTVDWYLSNRTWWESILARGYQLERRGL